MTKPAFVFLRETGEDNNNASARCAEQSLALGPMGNHVRGDDYESFLDIWEGGGKPVRGIATSCGMYVGTIENYVFDEHRRIPPARAITTWEGVLGFAEDDPKTIDLLEGSWIPVEKVIPTGGIKRGDILYWCGGGPTTWKQATNGHVGFALSGSGLLWVTAEGGGGADGTLCQMSVAPKDISKSHGRPWRGVWRPNLIGYLV